MRRVAGRVWFAVTAVAVLTGLVVQVFVTAGATTGLFPTTAGRLVNLFCYFTIQSNVIVLVTTALLAANPARGSTAFRVFRLAGLIGIAVTGIVFHTVLAGLNELAGAAKLADFLLHTASPLLTVLGWLLFGPRGGIDWRVIGLALIYPALWLVFTLVRGPIVDYYPYPFIDVDALGYPRVLLNCLVVALLFFALAAGARALDRVLTRRVVVS
ncbi:Pr6Pr family membrane protein [Actinokineospora sp. NBRC 105648]|uniref:Pr6Pr family membrane protein n=1 Tax=Actinokineospora sp. NBRC 105648 TaxID=3032206 RepID=UPI0024A174BA|nr:Pr6Pr family membrane protein [Actinokineospora sp. NBRC 105648]GLZ37810.1 hypothetical protein Acsp05_14350 [Actinokineospora sp. NBRC 105648]